MPVMMLIAPPITAGFVVVHIMIVLVEELVDLPPPLGVW
jgi:hypothetical protein